MQAQALPRHRANVAAVSEEMVVGRTGMDWQQHGGVSLARPGHLHCPTLQARAGAQCVRPGGDSPGCGHVPGPFATPSNKSLSGVQLTSAGGTLNLYPEALGTCQDQSPGRSRCNGRQVRALRCPARVGTLWAPPQHQAALSTDSVYWVPVRGAGAVQLPPLYSPGKPGRG